MKTIKTLCAMLALILLCGAAPAAFAWETACVTDPGWQYQDDTRSIMIQKVSENGVTYFAADVQLTDAALFKTYSGKKLTKVSALATEAGAVFAINGDDYGAHKYGVIIRNGQLLRTHNTTRNMLIVDKNGDMSVKVDRKNEPYKELGQQMTSEGVWQTFEFGPELVRDGQAVTFSKAFDVISTKSTRKEPRTAIGQIGPLHYVVIVVDGRQRGYSVGISLQDLQQLFISYGAQTAMNLDGGGSTTLWFQGELLNKPCSGKERRVSDIICF